MKGKFKVGQLVKITTDRLENYGIYVGNSYFLEEYSINNWIVRNHRNEKVYVDTCDFELAPTKEDIQGTVEETTLSIVIEKGTDVIMGTYKVGNVSYKVVVKRVE